MSRSKGEKKTNKSRRKEIPNNININNNNIFMYAVS